MIIIIAAAAAAAAIILLNVVGVFGDSESEEPLVIVEEDIDDTDDADDTDDMDTDEAAIEVDVSGFNKGWPSEGIPSGFPKYPNGDPYYDNIMAGMILIVIINTDQKTFDSYLDSLKDFGFAFSPVTSAGVHEGEVDGWGIGAMYREDEKSVRITVYSIGTGNGNEGNSGGDSGSTPNDWPEEIPVYPEGKISVGGSGSDYINITIKDTSQATMDAYADLLVEAGWELVLTDKSANVRGYEKGDRMLSLGMMMNNTTVTITIQNGQWAR